MSESKKSLRFFKTIIKIILPIIVLCLGLIGADYIKTMKPKQKRKRPQSTATLVQARTYHQKEFDINIKAMGTVIPSQQITLKVRVSGEVIARHPEFIEGGYLKSGDEIIKIDSKDYELIVKQENSKVVDASYALKLEQGQQDIAMHEWSLLNYKDSTKILDKELALRKPHLQKVYAELAAAKASLEQAKLDLTRTSIKSPFNAIVLSKNVDIGSQVSNQGEIAELVSADVYWIKVSVSLDSLQWITIPKNNEDIGSSVTVVYGNGKFKKEGRVIRLLSDLEEEGRMARLLVAVNDPLGRHINNSDSIPLLLNEFVRVFIKGNRLDNVFCIPRSVFRDGNNIWIVDTEKILQIRKIKPIWKDEKEVIFQDGIEPGERLIISNLSTPVNGMKVRIVEN